MGYFAGAWTRAFWRGPSDSLKTCKIFLSLGGLTGRRTIGLLRRLYGVFPEEIGSDEPLPGFFQVYKLCAEKHKNECSQGKASAWVTEAAGHLKLEIKRLREFKASIEDVERERNAYRAEASLIARRDAMDRLVRYEAHLSREYDRALGRLERLQRKRLGQPMPLPVKLELST